MKSQIPSGGKAGQVWTSDGTGAGIWADAPAGSEVWEEVDLNNFPSDWTSDDVIRISAYEFGPTVTGSGWEYAPSHTIGSWAVDTKYPLQYVTLRVPSGTGKTKAVVGVRYSTSSISLRILELDGPARLNDRGTTKITLRFVTFNAYGETDSADLLKNEDMAANIYKIWRLKK